MLETVSFETLNSAYKAEEDPEVRERILMIKMLKESFYGSGKFSGV